MSTEFAGMVYPDTHPTTVPSCWVTAVNVPEIPAPLREFAENVISAASGDEWWSIGEFRYADGHDYVTAVARWKRAGVQYGVEGD